MDTIPAGQSVVLNLREFGIEVGGEGFSVEELKKIARSARPAAALFDTDTWFDAETAVPLR